MVIGRKVPFSTCCHARPIRTMALWLKFALLEKMHVVPVDEDDVAGADLPPSGGWFLPLSANECYGNDNSDANALCLTLIRSPSVYPSKTARNA